MAQYTCFRCGYSIKQKSRMQAHLNRKRICDPILRNIKLDNYHTDILEQKDFVETEIPEEIHTNSENSHKCKYCNKTYKQHEALSHHLKLCRAKKPIREESPQIKALRENLDTLKSKIELKKRERINETFNNTTTNTTTNTYTTTNKTIDIYISNDMSPEEIKRAIQSSLELVPGVELSEEVYSQILSIIGPSHAEQLNQETRARRANRSNEKYLNY